MEARTCAHCGGAFVARRPGAKYCGSSCRGKASKARTAGTVARIPAPDAPRGTGPATQSGATEVAVRAELDAVSRASSALGVMALGLARALDDPMTPPGSKAALAKQLAATLTDALRLKVGSRVANLRGERDRLRAV